MKNNTVSIIKMLCDEKMLTLAELERTLGISNGSISKWAKSAPNSAALTKIADYFNVSIDYLLCRTNEPTLYEDWNKKYNAEKLERDVKKIETIAAHLDDVDLTAEEANMLELYIKALVKGKK